MSIISRPKLATCCADKLGTSSFHSNCRLPAPTFLNFRVTVVLITWENIQAADALVQLSKKSGLSIENKLPLVGQSFSSENFKLLSLHTEAEILVI